MQLISILASSSMLHMYAGKEWHLMVHDARYTAINAV